MKILFTNKKQRAYVKSIPTFNILNALKSKIDVEDLHILTDDGSQTNEFNIDPLKYNYKFFEDYKTDNILEILKKEKPDVLVSSNDFDYLGRSFIIGAKFLKIPTVLLLQGIFVDIYSTKSNHLLIRDRYVILKNRGKFILKKFLLLLKTYRKIGSGIETLCRVIIDDITTPFLYSEPAGKYGCDLILVRTDLDKNALKKRGIKSKIVVTGDPGMDSIFDDVSQKMIKNQSSRKRMKVVLITTAMVEHGLWTKKMWEETITQIVKEFCTKFSTIKFVLKIHPTSERIQDYKSLLKKIGFSVPIFQTENLVDVLSDADIVLSLEGGSWANWVPFFLKKPLIIINLVKDVNSKKFPYIKERVALELTEIEELGNLIQKAKNQHDNKKMDDFISKYLYKFDGRSSERSATFILDLVKNYNLAKK